MPQTRHREPKPFVASLSIKNFATESIDLTAVTNDIEALETKIVVKEEGREFFLVFTIPQDMPKGPHQGTVTVISTSDRHQELTVPVTFTVL